MNKKCSIWSIRRKHKWFKNTFGHEFMTSQWFMVISSLQNKKIAEKVHKIGSRIVFRVLLITDQAILASFWIRYTVRWLNKKASANMLDTPSSPICHLFVILSSPIHHPFVLAVTPDRDWEVDIEEDVVVASSPSPIQAQGLLSIFLNSFLNQGPLAA